MPPCRLQEDEELSEEEEEAPVERKKAKAKAKPASKPAARPAKAKKRVKSAFVDDAAEVDDEVSPTGCCVHHNLPAADSSQRRRPGRTGACCTAV